MEFRVLGPLEVCREGRAVAVPGGKPRAVLAVLLLHANEPVTTERLAVALWGEDAPAGAVRTAQVYVSRLRRALGEDEALTTSRAGYRIRVRPGELDLERFERLTEDGRRALAQARHQEARSLLHEALQLWRGPPLADLAFEPFAAAEIARLEEQRLGAVELRVEADLAVGGHAELVPELQRLVTQHPLRERLHGQLMLALYRTGRQGEALASYRRARDVLVEELGIEPGAELRDLHQAMLRQDRALAWERDGLQHASEPVEPPSSTIPTLQPRLVGRDGELRAVRALCEDPENRLVTISGPGGVGKTRLAVEVVRAVGGRFVSLASTASPEHAAGAICDGLNLARVPGERPEDALVRVFGSERILLVLDNLEHLVAMGPLLSRLLEPAPGLTILATSRRPLGLAAERLFSLQPFPVDDEPGPAAVSSPAVELFAERARARDASFSLTAENLPAIVEVCRRVNGLPLAIELAAGRLQLLGLEQLARRLDEPLRVLGPGPRDAPARQRTLRATLDWSFGLLDPDERAAFAALAVFAGGCDTEAAEAVTGQPLPVLEALVDHGLVVSRAGRLTMMVPIRQYAAERLADRRDSSAIHSRHAEYFLALAKSASHALWARGISGPAFARVHRERDNMRAALAWSLDTGDPRDALALAGALGEYFMLTSAYDEAREWCSRALAAAGDDAPVALVAEAHLAWALNLPDSAATLEHAHAALALFRVTGDDMGVARSLLRLGHVRLTSAEVALAVTLANEALDRGRRLGDDVVVGQALGVLALAAPRVEDAVPLLRDAEAHLRAAGAIETLAAILSTAGFLALREHADTHAERFLADAVDAASGVDSPFLHALIHGNRGLAALLQGRFADAAAAFREELAIAHRHALRTFYFEGFVGFAALAAASGDDDRAAALEAAALEHNDRPVFTSEQPVMDRLEQQFLEPARARLGPDAWLRASRAGSGLTPEAAIALTEQVDAPPRRRHLHVLNP